MVLLDLLLLASVVSAHDAVLKDALDDVYSGSLDRAISRFESLSEVYPRDPMLPYFEALALAWKAEQNPGSRVYDEKCVRWADRALQRAEASLKEDPGDSRALLARGAAHGIKSRLALFRRRGHPAAREAALMRETLLILQKVDPSSKDALFGLGLYDYFMDVLPRLAKLLRFLAGYPPGDRLRGLEAIELARESALFHKTEALAQLFVIDSSYEKRWDRALAEIRELRTRYPGAPLWALRLAEIEEQLGLYAEAAREAEKILLASERGEANYAPVVGDMARIVWANALVSDLQCPEARKVLLSVKEFSEAPWILPRSHILLGRCSELDGDRDAAVAQYRIAALSGRGDEHDDAESALSHPLSKEIVKGSERLAAARRLRESGRIPEAVAAFREARRVWPESQEASLRAAEADLADGKLEEARGSLEALASRPAPSPLFVRPWSRFLLARLNDLQGAREAAIKGYKEVYEHPFGEEELKEWAAKGIQEPNSAPSASHRPSDYHR